MLRQSESEPLSAIPSVAAGDSRPWRLQWATALSAALVLVTTGGLALVLPAHGHFLADEARLYDGAVQIVQTGRLAPFGPWVSGTSPPLVLPGGAAFDLFAIPFLLGTAPWLGTLFVVLLAGAGLWIFDRALLRLELPTETRLFAVALFGFSIWHARFADRLWNYHPFQLVSPILLWVAARLRKEPASIPLALALGAGAGVAMQLNPTGILVIAIACALAFEPPGRRPVRVLAIAAVGVFLVYLPYLVADAPHGFAVARALFGDRAGRPVLGREAWRSLVVFPAFASQSTAEVPWRTHGFLAPALSFWCAFPVTAFGLFLPSPLRRVCLLALVLVPASFLLSGRYFTPHYVVSLLPLYFIPTANALAFAWNRGRLGAGLALAYMATFATLGLVLLNREYLRPLRPTIAVQLAVTDALLALNRPVHWVDDSVLDDPSIYEALARRARGRDLILSGPGPDAWLAQPPVASSLVVRER
jgi:hypothetical protein